MANSRFSILGQRLNTGLVWVALLTLPLIMWGASRAFSVFSNDVRQWLPSGFEEAQQYDWFTKYFGVDEMVVVSWPGCEIDSPELFAFAENLRDYRDGNGQLTFDRVLTGDDVLTKMLDAGMSLAEAKERSTGIYLGNDGKTTCCLCYPSAANVQNRASVVQLVLDKATKATGLALEQIHIGGPTVDGAAIDQESKTALKNFLWMTFVVVLLLTWVRTRKFTLSLVIIFMALYCAAVGLAVLRWTGGTMNLTMIMLPTLTFILAVSGAVHMTNYYLKSLKLDSTTARQEAVRHGGFPVVMSSLTTAVGMGSLAVSKIWPIKLFGVYSATAVLVSLPVLLILLPAALETIRRRLPSVFANVSDEDSNYSTNSGVVMWLSHSVWKWNIAIVLISVSVLVFLGSGVARLKATVNVQNRFAPSTKIIQDYTWLEQNLGPLVPMEVILRIPNEFSIDNWNRMHLVELMEKRIRKSDFVQASYSAATFRPNLPERGNRVVHESIIQAWNNSFEQLVKSRLVYSERDEQLWRISIRIAAMEGADYGKLLDSIGQEVNAYLDEINEKFYVENQEPIKAVLTGGVPMMYKAQHQVLNDLGISFLTAFLLISLVLVVVLRGVVPGLVAMLPNVFPPLIVFGTMGWLGLPIEIGSVMTASVAMGIAVDDTIHFLSWYRRATLQGMERRESVMFAYKFCAKSMVDTTLICGLGVSPFMFSVFMPTVRFARLMLLLLLVGLLGDLVMLPALLFGPIGVLFRNRKPDLLSEIEPETGQNIKAFDETTI